MPTFDIQGHLGYLGHSGQNIVGLPALGPNPCPSPKKAIFLSSAPLLTLGQTPTVFLATLNCENLCVVSVSRTKKSFIEKRGGQIFFFNIPSTKQSQANKCLRHE